MVLFSTTFLLKLFILSWSVGVIYGQTDSKQNTQETFCGKYSECHSRARKEFENCVGGAMQMVIARHVNMEKLFASNVTAENEKSLAGKCEHEMADNISEDIRILYERIDQFTARCISEVNKGSFALDQTQAFICKAVQGEIETQALTAFKGVKGKAECHQIYQSELGKCQLARDCCPQFEQCRAKIELESGIKNKEYLLMQNFEKCVKESIVKSNSVTFTKTESIGLKQESGISKNLINGAGVRFAPPNHSPSQISNDETDSATLSSSTALPKFSFPTLPPPDKTLRTLVDLLFPHLRQQNSSLNSLSINATQAPDLVAERRLRIELKDKLKEAKARMQSEKQKLADLTSSTQPETTTTPEPTTTSNTVEISASTPSQLDSLIVNTQAKEDDKHSKTKKRRKHVLASNYKKTVTNIFCSQHFECQEVFREYVKRCEDRYKEPAEKHGIDDYHFRKLFEQNSKVGIEAVKTTCLKSIDPDTQNHLITLRSQVEKENIECTFADVKESRIANNFTDQELKKCESIKLLNLLSTVINSEESGFQRGEKSYQKCISRLEKLQEKCEELKGCCPNSSECDQYNESREAKKYSEILVQLKEEQNLCEARHLRIRNGIMT